MSAGLTRAILCLLVSTLACVGASEATFVIHAGAPRGFRKEGAAFVPLANVLDFSDPELKAVVFEAEDADDRLLVKTARDAADGCTYVASLKLLRFYYLGGKARRGSLWARLRQGAEPKCLNLFGHTWNSETAYKERKLDPKTEHARNAGKWRWERLRDFPLAAGLNGFDVLWAWPGTPDLDRFAVCFGEGPPEPGTSPAARAAVTEPLLESVSFAHSAAVRLMDARVEGRAEGVVLEATVDEGRTWRPAAQVALDGAVPGAFRLRARFPQRAPEGVQVRHFVARVQMEGGNHLVLENRHARLDFDAGRHGLFRFSRPEAGVTLAAPVEAIPFFSLELKKRGQPWPKPPKVLWCQKDARFLGARLHELDGAPAAGFEYEFLDGRLKAAVNVRLGADGETRWTLALDNRSEWDVLTYTFPRVAGLKVGDSGYDDRWANTNLYGPWMAGSQPEDRPYPGWGALGWADLYDADAGLSFAVRDCLDGRTSFQLRPDPAQWPEACKLEAVKEHCVAAGEQRVWTFILLPHAGDWHAAADHYGAWFRKEFGAADHFPDWARDSEGWIEANPALLDSFYRWPLLLDAFEEGQRMGVNHLQVWGQFGSNSCGSFWWPSPKYGSIEEFAAVNAEIRKRGGHVGYYLMFHLDNRYNHLDSQTYDGYLPRDRYPKEVPLLSVEEFQKAMSVPDPEGKLTGWPQTPEELAKLRESLDRLLAEKKTTVWADGAQWTMNPLERTWQDYLARWTDGLYVGRWHCDAAYQDVLGCETVGRSFDLRRGDHGHFHARANYDLARRLFEDGRKLDPAFALIAEGKSELVTRWALGMTSSSHYGWIYVDAHRYTHPDHILFLGGANGGWNQPLYNAQLAFLYGARHDLILSQDADRIREVLALRRPLLRYVTRARYRDTVGLRFSGEGLEARRFDRLGADHAAALVCVVNPKRVTGGSIEVNVEAFGAEAPHAFWFAADGTARAVQLARQGAWLTAESPPSHVSALLLVSRPPPGEELLARVSPDFEPGAIQAPYWVANLSPAARRARLSFTGPGWAGEPREVEVPAYGVADGVLSWPSANALAGGEVSVALEGRTLARSFLVPMVNDGSFEKRPPPAEGSACDGKSFLRFGPAKGWQGHGMRIHLRPARRYHASAMGRRTGAQGQQIHGLVRMKSERRGWQHAGLNFPPNVFNQWVKLEADFVTPEDLTEADLYLYNCDSQETVDYDLVCIEMTPAGKNP